MKERSKGFAAGILAATLVGALGFTALAATGQVSFNASALSLNGTQVSAKGENYTLANGQSVPASITYTDEKGGGTTYLPVRRISELLGVETGWDGATGSVTIKGAALPSQPPVTTTPPTNYSDWSKEDEEAYQEFKGMWKFEAEHPAAVNGSNVYFSYTGKDADLVQWADDHAPAQRFFEKMAVDRYSGTGTLYMVFWYRGDNIFASVFIDKDGSIRR